MTSRYALFIYDPLLNDVTYAATHASNSKEAMICWANAHFKDTLMFFIYKFKDNCILFDQMIPAERWFLDTKFAGKGIHPSACHSTPLEYAYCVDGKYWFFKSS